MKRSRFFDTSCYDRAGILVCSEVRTCILFYRFLIDLYQQYDHTAQLYYKQTPVSTLCN